MTAPTATADTVRREAWRFLLRGLATAGFGFVIAAILWVLRTQSYPSTLVYTLCISLCCWFLIDGARITSSLWIQRKAGAVVGSTWRWPGWQWMLPVVVVGSVLGYAIGNELGNVLLGKDLPGPFNADLRQTLTVLVLAIVPGVIITYVFQSRETIAAQMAMVDRTERQATEQRLKLLESQLEPHMLFNTLANLRALIAIDPTLAQAMLDRLIAFLRASLAGSRASLGSVEEEFARLADYLALIQIRMGPRLATSFDVAPGAARAQLPSLLLQPLIENSIRHGLEPQVSGGRVAVTAEREGDALVLRVRDTGVGTGCVDRWSRGFGLSLVRERLATLYGDQASLQLGPADDAEGGTLATVRMPFSAFVAQSTESGT